MKLIDKIKDYSKRENEIILKKRLRPFFLWVLIGYVILIVSLFFYSPPGILIDILSFPLVFVFRLPMFDGIRAMFTEISIENFTLYHWLIVWIVLLIAIAYLIILIIVFLFIPGLMLVTRYEQILDKIYVGNEVKTTKWREKYGNKEDYMKFESNTD